MKLVFILFLLPLLSVNQTFAIDVGDGSDGTCDVTGAATTQITSAKKNYQCTTLDLNGNLNDFKGGNVGGGGAPLVIKVQNNVTVSVGVTIDLSGASGIDGDNSAHAGGDAGAGGGAGGNSQLGLDGLNGNGSGAGILGKFVVDNPGGTSSYGGGGGGGSYKTKSATEPDNGSDSIGIAPLTKGTNGNNFLASESQFDSSFQGGSGGAAGGGGAISGTPVSGSSGGGGGGALRIISGGNIVIDGSLIADGGAGGGTVATASSGGGGGASGGAIWLQAFGTLTVSATGTITALGGAGGTNDFASGFGGSGGNGGIRLDDADGVITNLGIVSPAPYSTNFSPTAITSGNSAISRQYSSAIACGRVILEDDVPINNLINLFLGMMIASGIYFLLSKKENI